jgi:hypothetical protein
MVLDVAGYWPGNQLNLDMPVLVLTFVKFRVTELLLLAEQ